MNFVEKICLVLLARWMLNFVVESICLGLLARWMLNFVERNFQILVVRWILNFDERIFLGELDLEFVGESFLAKFSVFSWRLNVWKEIWSD